MGKAMKALAIAALLITIAGAGTVLYAVNTWEPVIVQSAVSSIPAEQAKDIFDAVVSQVKHETFTGRAFGGVSGLEVQDCTFLTYTVRLKNRGFFPAEWIALDVQPVEGDVLQLDNVQANVLPSGTEGDIAATILHRGDASDAQRTLEISAYVFGRKATIESTAE